MSQRIQSITTFTPTATADTTNLVDATYVTVLKGGSGTARCRIIEIMESGQAGASSPTFMLLARDSTVAVTLSQSTGGADAATDPANEVLTNAIQVGSTATTKPQRSSTLKLMNLSFNAFGGIVRWVTSPEENVYTVGNTASLGEVSLSAFTGGTTGLMGGHVVYEPI